MLFYNESIGFLRVSLGLGGCFFLKKVLIETAIEKFDFSSFWQYLGYWWLLFVSIKIFIQN